MRYLAGLSPGRFILWCYFLWWGVVLVRYFDPSPRLWLTSLGLSVIIGVALVANASFSGKERVRLGFWPAFRFFLIPFCVSSFAALIKDRDFILIFPPKWQESGVAAGICLAFGLLVAGSKRLRPQEG